MTPATLVHELAHALAGVAAGHGPAFRRAHVDLVGYVFGDTEAGWLLDAYAQMGLEPGSARGGPRRRSVTRRAARSPCSRRRSRVRVVVGRISCSSA